MKKFTHAKFLVVLGILLLCLGHVSGGQALAGSHTLKLATLYSPGRELYKTVQYFADEVAKKTNGEVKFKIFPGNSLVPAKQALSSVHSGVLDAAFVPGAYEQSLWPLTGMLMTFGAPNITYAKWRTIHGPIRDIINKHLNINVVIVSMPHVLHYLFYSKAPVTGAMKDFQNTLVRSAGGAYDASFKALGCAPVKIPASESYMALQKGTIDSGWNIYSRYVGAKLYEVAPNVMLVPKGMIICGQYFVINKGVWESLSSKNRKAIMEVGSRVVSFTNDMSAASDKLILDKKLPALKIQPKVMSQAVNQELLNKLAPTWGPVIQKNGKPGQEIAKILGVR
ncbi:MAG: TRAP transporter substrate-binding protein DctP [Proteobacteria bacterium]|nr:TRAP transporter substrate-binding protein DctP [Pseudomonadota bacterium]MBU4574915.1 TRAP transporter substrate-binding protein DctP [Pseudomonadota bacterium]MBU4597105.1 TRAP transporter substrate-binding protein DctP [Pseudomonadota bacterium]MBV1715347.1 TRAP transporter substrate-binding protein DctP [Desulfarculus sp.]